MALAASLFISLGTWRWAQRVLVPSNTVAAQRSGVPVGNNSDLYPRWLGARELLLHHRDPYSTEVTREIQEGFYGRPLDLARPADPSDQAAFAYPLYVVFLLAPTVTLPFALVVSLCRWLFLFGIAASVPLWMRAIGFHLRLVWVVSAMVLVVSTYPSVLEFYMQNLAAVVAVLLALASAALVRDWLVFSGFLLALATIKPQLSTFFVLWFLLWASGGWQERRRLVFSFGLTLLALVLGGEILLPGWLGKFLTAARSYREYVANPSGLRMFFPPLLAWMLAAVLLGALLVLGWQRQRARAGSSDFGWMLAWVAVVTTVVAPIALYNQVVLIPALLALLAQRELIWKAGRVPRALAKAAFTCLIWQWGTAAIIGWGSLVLPAERLRPTAYAPVYTLLALPPITLLAIAAGTVALRPREADSGDPTAG